MKSPVNKLKHALREEMILHRNSLASNMKHQYDQDICDSLKTLVTLKKSTVVHAYLPMKGEIDISPFLKWLLVQGVKVICPKVLPKRQLVNIELQSYGSFEVGPFNTYHPAGNVVYEGKIDLVVMPGLAFDQNKNRLGYGGGYYDRFLSKHPESFLAAILYPFQLVEKVPVEEHDVKMNKLIYMSGSA